MLGLSFPKDFKNHWTSFYELINDEEFGFYLNPKELDKEESDIISDDEVALMYDEKADVFITPCHKSITNLMGFFNYSFDVSKYNPVEGLVEECYSDSLGNSTVISYDIQILNSQLIKNGIYKGIVLIPIFVIKPTVKIYNSFTQDVEDKNLKKLGVLDFIPKNNFGQILSEVLKKLERIDPTYIF